jgi:hypothetical protein
MKLYIWANTNLKTHVCKVKGPPECEMRKPLGVLVPEGPFKASLIVDT